MTFNELKKELVDDIGKIYTDEIKKLKDENKTLKEALKQVKSEITSQIKKILVKKPLNNINI